MNNISFGVMYPTMREITEESVSPGLKNTAHSITDVAYGSLSGMIATACSGTILDNAGVQMLGIVCAAFQMIAIGWCIVLLANGHKKRSRIRVSSASC